MLDQVYSSGMAGANLQGFAIHKDSQKAIPHVSGGGLQSFFAGVPVRAAVKASEHGSPEAYSNPSSYTDAFLIAVGGGIAAMEN
jgi:hypothetical protein